jgi:DNA-binding NtrC family response regulator
VIVALQDETGLVDRSKATVLALRREFPVAPLLFIAPSGSESLAVAIFRAGAVDYLRWPASPSEFADAWHRLVPVSHHPTPEPCLLGRSLAIHSVRESVRRFATTPCSVLITGETGTGKELAAGLLHRSSARAEAPFVPINCAAIPETLVESELFGYERGAFSGAVASSAGRLNTAHRGTVLLDEIGELSLTVQAKLLRVIEHGELQRLGARQTRRVDLRWVAATNRDLAALTRDGRFRADLYYRLSVAEISIPPLRERPEDIWPLTEHFLRVAAEHLGRPDARFSSEALERLETHDWPGNVRELRNVIESSLIRSDGDEIGVGALPPSFERKDAPQSASMTERHRLLRALEATAWNKTQAAEMLHWSRMTLYRKLSRYGIGVTGRPVSVTESSSHV